MYFEAEKEQVNYKNLNSMLGLVVLRRKLCKYSILNCEKRLNNFNNHRMYDVGGQCGERMKWCQAYNNIDAVLFVVDSSCFDTKLREKNKNRLEDSLELFEIIWFSKYLKESGIILFFNKQDILKEKIENGAKIEIFFPDYNDYQLKNNIKNDKNENPEYMKAKYFIRDKFMNITEKVKEQNNEYCKNVDFKRDEKPFFHFTTATDTENMEKIFKNVHLIRMINNLNFMYSP